MAQNFFILYVMVNTLKFGIQGSDSKQYHVLPAIRSVDLLHESKLGHMVM